MVIDFLIKQAILERNSSKKEAYRAIKSELLLNSSSKNPEKIGKLLYKTNSNMEIYELELKIIRKLIKQREESIVTYEANSRNDLVEIEKEQIKYLKELLPPEVKENDIKESILKSYPEGYTQKEIGKVIKSIKDEFPTADNKLISNIVKTHILK